jgi:hypothetical protein
MNSLDEKLERLLQQQSLQIAEMKARRSRSPSPTSWQRTARSKHGTELEGGRDESLEELDIFSDFSAKADAQVK